ncbi:MAG: adenylate cyclase [Desulfobacteraceae bacterium]|nr:adenylate cyclase [Desulfobacteraceae bacterium]
MTSSIFRFNSNNFESHWDTLDEESQGQLVEQASNLDLSLGILPILAGIISFHFTIRSKARKSLETIRDTIQEQLKNTDDPATYRSGVEVSAMISARVYQQIKSEMPFNDINFFLKILLELGDQGAYFAFKAVYQERVSLDSIKKVIQLVGQPERLVFVDQYLQAMPTDRLKFARLFKSILNGITHRESVTKFYARLFDHKRDADSFLNNINFDLRDPETILQDDLESPSPAIKITGLKALSLMETKICVEQLLKVIEGQEVKKLRLAVYGIIENSSMGLYPELFDPVFKHFYRCGRCEAVDAFRALVMTGKLPVYKLFKMIRDTYPEIMSSIYIEIASLSRISFFVIQDIALNKENYLTDNLDINLACILGMTQKRPERVIKIFNDYEKLSGHKSKIDVLKFVEKTKLLLSKEKEKVQPSFDTLVAKLKKKPKKLKIFFSAILQDPVKKKIEALKKKIPVKSMDFTGHKFENENLSGLKFSTSKLFFNQAIFENTDLSKAYFVAACFKGSIFHNVNMDGVIFDNVKFDNAVFINVSAQKTVFKNCSFQGARLYNCNFDRADLTDAVFIDAVISQCSFGDTQLSCASFAHGRISWVSFASAHLNLVDFSGVRAQFSRFPFYARSIIRTQTTDFNDRRYQLDFNDLPHIDKAVIGEINMLIFCEFIHYGENKFLDQNKLSLLTAFDIFNPSQADFFQIVPLLIHENFQFLEMNPIHSKTPCGIADYMPSGLAVDICEKYTGKNKFKVRRNFKPLIEGLFTMGSIGSLAQTFESDIDYWVCINEDLIESSARKSLINKLNLIETMALNKFKIQVTFFVVDVLKAKNNDFGLSSQESSGSAQGRLLKEEFYRTMIHVAGKLPLWAVLPTTISLNYYNTILAWVDRFTRSHRYIDLGDIHAIPVNEYFGASIWQMFKWLKSPFKSVIKMAVLEKYIHAYGKEPLLCNRYKNEWMNSGTHLKLAQNDSYIILLKHLIEYYHQRGDSSSVTMLGTCFFLKLEISKQEQIDGTVFGLRKILLEKSLAIWGWDKKRIFEIGKFREWPYASIHRLSITIEQYVYTKYNQLKKQFEDQASGELIISKEDRQVLERKVSVVFSEKPHKIKKILLVSGGRRYFERLNLKHVPKPETPGMWELFHKNLKIRQDNEESLIKANCIEEIGAWLINNDFYRNHCIVNLIPNPTVVTHEDIEKLFKTMYDFFDPYIKNQASFNELLKKKSRIISLFICVNFYTVKQESSITDYCAIYVNSWGEMYLRSSWPGKTFSTMEMAKKHLLKNLGIEKFPLNTAFYFSKGLTR